MLLSALIINYSEPDCRPLTLLAQPLHFKQFQPETISSRKKGHFSDFFFFFLSPVCKLSVDVSVPATNSIFILSKPFQWLMETEQYPATVNVMSGPSLSPLFLWPFLHCPLATEDASSFLVAHSLVFFPTEVHSIEFTSHSSLQYHWKLQNTLSCSCLSACTHFASQKQKEVGKSVPVHDHATWSFVVVIFLSASF